MAEKVLMPWERDWSNFQAEPTTPDETQAAPAEDQGDMPWQRDWSNYKFIDDRLPGMEKGDKPEPPTRTIQEKAAEKAGISTSGRPVWQTPEGEQYSEKTVTFPLDDEGKSWATFPSVDASGKEMSEDKVKQYVLQNGLIDPITGEKFPTFNSREEALAYAKERSATRLKGEPWMEAPEVSPFNPPAPSAPGEAPTTAERVSNFGEGVVRGGIDTTGLAAKGLATLGMVKDIEGVTGLFKSLDSAKDWTPQQRKDFRWAVRNQLTESPGLGMAMIDAADKMRRGEIKSIQDDPELVKKFQAAIQDPRERQAFALGEWLKAYGQENFGGDPRLQEAWDTKIAQGFGSTLPFLALGLMPGGQVLGPMAGTFMGRGEALENALDAQRQGKKVDRQQLLDAVGWGTIPGASESIPIENLLGRLPGGKALEAMGAIGRIGMQVLVEGGQEAFQQFAQNVIQNYVYDPKKDLTEGILESAAIGGIVGGGMGAVTEGVKATGSAVLGKGDREEGPPEGDATISAEATATGQTSTGPVKTKEDAVPPGPRADQVLKDAGWTEEEIAGMAPQARARAVEEAIQTGVKPAPQPGPAPGTAPAAPPIQREQPTREPTSDIDAQLRDLKDPNNARTAVYLSPTTVQQAIDTGKLDAMKAAGVAIEDFDGKGGILIAENDQFAQMATQAKADGVPTDQIIGILTGSGQGKPEGGDTVVQQRDEQGNVTRETVTTADQAQQTAQAMQESGRGTTVLSPEQALDEREARAAAEVPEPGKAPAAPPRVGSKDKPIDLDQVGKQFGGVFGAREDAREAVEEPKSDAQAEAGNYKHAHVSVNGFGIAMETPKGGRRTGTNEDGQRWAVKMPADYGRLKGTKGMDGDQIDVYLGENTQASTVYIINQRNLDGSPDEHKVMMGFDSEKEARDTYFKGFSDGSGQARLDSMVPMSLEEFQDWIDNGDHTKFVGPSDEATQVQRGEDNQGDVGASPVSPEPTPEGGEPRAQGSMESSDQVGGRGAGDRVQPDPEQLRAFRNYLVGPGSIADIDKLAKQLKMPRDVVAAMLQDAAKDGAVIATKSGSFRRAPKEKKPVDLIRFVAHIGGIADPDGDVSALTGGTNPLVPGKGKLIRAKGNRPDKVRELAVEAGYLPEGASIRDLYDAMDRNMRGDRVIRDEDAEWEQELQAQQEQDALNEEFPTDAEKDLVRKHGIGAARKLIAFQQETGLGVGGMSDEEVARAASYIDQGMDVDSAIERAAIEYADEGHINGYDDITEIPVDEIYPDTAPADGETIEADFGRDEGPEEEGQVQRPRQDVPRTSEKSEKLDNKAFDLSIKKAKEAGIIGDWETNTTMSPDKVFPKLTGKVVRAEDVAGDYLPPAEAKSRVKEWKDFAKAQGDTMQNSNRVILSLFDYTGNWSKPFVDAGFTVVQYDIELMKEDPEYAPGDERFGEILSRMPTADIIALRSAGYEIYGVMSACPCTTFASSGARWWESLHDVESREAVEKVFGEWVPQGFESPFEYNKALVAATEVIIEFANPTGFHVLENPVGRLGRATGLDKPQYRFDPNNFGDPYTKKTQLWGDFGTELPTANVEPTEGSLIHKKSGKDRSRSDTPLGFAYAFFMANNPDVRKPSRVVEDRSEMDPEKRAAREEYWGWPNPIDGKIVQRKDLLPAIEEQDADAWPPYRGDVPEFGKFDEEQELENGNKVAYSRLSSLKKDGQWRTHSIYKEMLPKGAPIWSKSASVVAKDKEAAEKLAYDILHGDVQPDLSGTATERLNQFMDWALEHRYDSYKGKRTGANPYNLEVHSWKDEPQTDLPDQVQFSWGGPKENEFEHQNKIKFVREGDTWAIDRFTLADKPLRKAEYKNRLNDVAEQILSLPGLVPGAMPQATDLFATEAGADGKGQTVMPGMEKISDKELAERKAKGKKKAAVAQKDMDEGLFGTDKDQVDIADVEQPSGLWSGDDDPRIPEGRKATAEVKKPVGYTEIFGHDLNLSPTFQPPKEHLVRITNETLIHYAKRYDVPWEGRTRGEVWADMQAKGAKNAGYGQIILTPHKAKAAVQLLQNAGYGEGAKISHQLFAKFKKVLFENLDLVRTEGESNSEKLGGNWTVGHLRQRKGNYSISWGAYGPDTVLLTSITDPENGVGYSGSTAGAARVKRAIEAFIEENKDRKGGPAPAPQEPAKPETEIPSQEPAPIADMGISIFFRDDGKLSRDVKQVIVEVGMHMNPNATADERKRVIVDGYFKSPRAAGFAFDSDQGAGIRVVDYNGKPSFVSARQVRDGTVRIREDKSPPPLPTQPEQDEDAFLDDIISQELGEQPAATPLAKIKSQLIAYASGMTRTKDFAAGAYAWGKEKNLGLGVDATELTTEAIKAIAERHVNMQTNLFVDSGAFGVFRRNMRAVTEYRKAAGDLFRQQGLPTPKLEKMDFDNVIARYEHLQLAIENENVAEDQDVPAPLFVAPDIVGDQQGSLDLLRQFAPSMRFIGKGQVVVPLQKGDMTLAEAYAKAKAIMGGKPFIAGIPSNAKAVSAEEFRQFVRESDATAFHFLGALSPKTLDPKLQVLADENVDITHVSADANLLRSALYGSAVAKELGRPDAIVKTLDEQRTIGQAAASAAKNIGEGLKDVGDAFNTLFNDPNKLKSGIGFDEETYARAKPIFKAGAAHFYEAGMDIAEVLQKLVRWLMAKDGGNQPPEAINRARPYLKQFVKDVRDGKEQIDVPDRQPDMEPGRGGEPAQDRLRETNVPAAAGPDGEGAGGGRGQTGETQEGGPGSGGGISGSNASPMGSRIDQRISRPEAGISDFNPTDTDTDGGVEGGQPRLPIDNGRPDSTSEFATDSPGIKDRQKAQAAAESIEVKDADLDNIRETLPMLYPKQQEDVYKIEQRFTKGAGMLITNGTGTGKTFSGLGVIKRFAKKGKGNILIVAPSDGILRAWITSGKLLGIDINKLDDTKSVGEGIVATTYANLANNETLADREWDLVVTDEAHNLSSNKDGAETANLSTFRAITRHPRAVVKRTQMLHRDLMEKIRKVKSDLEVARTADDQRWWAQIEGYERQLKEYWNQYQELQKAVEADMKAKPRPKALFLSATPFAHVFSVDYAEGYLFDYPADKPGGGYNSADGRNAFFVENFGFRMRYNKLTRPEAEVDSSVMERQFHEKLKKEGALSGRKLDVEHDYDRRFQTVNDKEGARIDEGFKWLRDQGKGFHAVADIYQKNFDYLSRMRLLEAMKAKAAIPYIQAHLDAGRKVMVFNNFNEGGGFTVFPKLISDDEVFWYDDNMKQQSAKLKDLYQAFEDANPWITKLDFSDYDAPRHTLRAAFGDRFGEYNGTVTAKKRAENLERFNKPESGLDVLGVQADAGGAGLSGHDTLGIAEGGRQRVLMNLGMPVRPVTAIQQEGRIYRDGQMSNAMFRYFTTGTTWERMAFAGSIAEKSETVENLGMGDMARSLRDSFVDAYEEAGDFQPGHEDEGVGGKERDAPITNNMSDFERAKTHYWAIQKNTSKRESRGEYYATPEPVGVKMVEWANIKGNERVLEPSAGHGAISRYIPANTSTTIIDTNEDLLSSAMLRTQHAKAIRSQFEGHNIVNKYDAVVMNPPFGQGGSLAIAHLEKAVKHLRNGGRVVALIPTGPAADAKFDKWWHNTDGSLGMVAEIKLPSVTFARAGTGVMTRIVVIEKQTDKEVGTPMGPRADLSGAQDINTLFDALDNITLPPRAEPLTKDIDAPAIGEFRIAGIDVNLQENVVGLAKGVKLSKEQFKHWARLGEAAQGTYLKSLRGWMFDNQEMRDAFLASVEKNPEPAIMAEPAPATLDFEKKKAWHAVKQRDTFVAVPNQRISTDDYARVKRVAQANGGYWSKYAQNGAIPGWQFESEAARDKFIDEIKAARPKDLGARTEVPLWYSRLARFVQTIPMAKGTPDQFAAMIQKGPLKPSEIAWSGVIEWLETEKNLGRQVERDRLLEWLNDNQIAIDENVRQGGSPLAEEFWVSDFEREEPGQEYVDDIAQDYLPDELQRLADDKGVAVDELDDADEEAAFDAARQQAYDHASEMASQRANGTYTGFAGDQDFEVTQDADTGEMMLYMTIEGVHYSESLRRFADSAEIKQAVREMYSEHYRRNDEDYKETLHAEHTEPGGEDYTELTLTLPYDTVKIPQWAVTVATATPGVRRVISRYTDRQNAEWWIKENKPDDAEVELQWVNRTHLVEDHWPDEENVIAHLRFKTRYIDGKKVMAIEEVQGDLGQELRDKKKELARLEGNPAVNKDYLAVNKRDIDFLEKFPFTPSEEWSALAIRRALRWAVDNGFDRVAWTPGVVQAKRWKADHYINAFTVLNRSEYAGTPTFQLTLEADTGLHILEFDDRQTIISAKGWVMSKNLGKNLKEVFGEQMAADIVAAIKPKDGTGFKQYKEPIRWGGEGHRFYYDTLLPKLVGKIAKPFGAKVEALQMADLPTPVTDADVIAYHDMSVEFWRSLTTRQKMDLSNEAMKGNAGGYQKWWSLDVNDAMRQEVSQGIPLWQKKYLKAANPNEGRRLTTREQVRIKEMVDEVAQRVLGRSLRGVKLFTRLYDEANSGAYEHGTGVIKLALEGWLNPLVGIRHESIHALLRTGVISKPEFGVLRRNAARWRRDYSIEERYRDFFEENYPQDMPGRNAAIELSMDEEAIAEAFARHWMLQEERGIIARIFNKMKNFLEALRNGLTGLGYESAEQIFSRIEEGEVGERTPRIPRSVSAPTTHLYASGKPAPARSIEMGDTPSITLAKPPRLFAKDPRFNFEEGADGKPQSMIPGSESMTKAQLDIIKSREAKRRAELTYKSTLKPTVEQEKIGGLFEQVEKDDDPQGSLFVRNVLQGSHAVSIPQRTRRMLQHLRQGASEYTVLWRRRMQDRFIDWKNLERKMALPEYLSVYRAEELYYGKVGGRMDDMRWTHFEPIMRAIRDKKIKVDEFNKFLMAMHAKERNDFIATRNPKMPDAGSGIATQDALDYLNMLRRHGKLRDMMDVGRMVWAMNQAALDERLADGLISAQLHNDLSTRWNYYVPLRGWAVDLDPDADPELPRVGKGFSVMGKEWKAALGRESVADDPLAYSFTQMQEAIVRGEKNRVSTTFLRLMRRYPAPDTWEEIKGHMRRHLDKKTGTVKEIWEPETGYDKDVLTIKVNGKPVYVKIKDKNLRKSMLEMGSTDMGWVQRHLHKLNRFLAAVNTSHNPEFILTNLARDIQTAAINVTQADIKGLEKAMLMDMPKAFKGALRGSRGDFSTQWAQHYKEFNEDGGKIAFFAIDDIEAQKKKMVAEMHRIAPGNPARAAFNYVMKLDGIIQDYNMAVENTLRLSAYVNARRLGASRSRAASLARNLTVNFNKRGEWGTAMNAWYLFYNAGIQGSFRMLQALRYSRKAQIAAGILVASGMLLDIFNRWIGSDDDEEEMPNRYDQIPAWEKERNWILMVPGADNGHYIKIPMPWGYNTFHVLGQQIGRLMPVLGDPKAEVSDALNTILVTSMNAFNPVGGSDRITRMLSPTIGDPFFDIGENLTWFDSPLMPDYGNGDKRPDSQKAWNSTPQKWKDLATFLNEQTGGNQWRPGGIDVSPETLQYWYEFATGGAGAFANRTANFAERMAAGQWDKIEMFQVPFARRFYGTPNDRQLANDFYNLLDEARIVEKEIKGFHAEGKHELAKEIASTPAGATYKRIKKAHNTIAQLKSRMKEIQGNGSLTEEQKDERLKPYVDKVEHNMRNAVKAYYNAAKEASGDTLTDNLLDVFR